MTTLTEVLKLDKDDPDLKRAQTRLKLCNLTDGYTECKKQIKKFEDSVEITTAELNKLKKECRLSGPPGPIRYGYRDGPRRGFYGRPRPRVYYRPYGPRRSGIL